MSKLKSLKRVSDDKTHAKDAAPAAAIWLVLRLSVCKPVSDDKTQAGRLFVYYVFSFARYMDAHMSWVGIMNICIPIAEMCRDSESVCEINYQIDWFKSATLVGSKRYDGDV